MGNPLLPRDPVPITEVGLIPEGPENVKGIDRRRLTNKLRMREWRERQESEMQRTNRLDADRERAESRSGYTVYVENVQKI